MPPHFCEQCLNGYFQTLKSRKQPLTCPCCKKEHLNISSANDLPINFVIQSALDIINAAPKELDDEHANPSIRCARCLEEEDEHNDAIQFCQECQLPLCDAHVTVHQKVNKTKDHVLIPVDQMPKNSAPVSIKRPCPNHKGEKLKFLCQCDELICRDCAITEHEGHKKTDIDTADKEERANVKQLIMQTQQDVNPVEKSLSEVTEMMQKIEMKCEDECKKVEDAAKELETRMTKELPSC